MRLLSQTAERRSNDPDNRMSDAVTLADVGDLSDHIDLGQLDRDQFPRWIEALASAEANAHRLREKLEEMLDRPSQPPETQARAAVGPLDKLDAVAVRVGDP